MIDSFKKGAKKNLNNFDRYLKIDSKNHIFLSTDYVCL